MTSSRRTQRSFFMPPLWARGIAACFLLALPARAQLYVSPTGTDTGPGTIDTPYATIQRAVSAVTAGGIIYVRGGTYLHATGISLNKHGAAGQPIRLQSFPGETPVLDFSPQPRGTASRGVTMGYTYWQLRGLTIHSAGDNGLYITGSNNTVEACVLHDNEDTGLQISGGGSNNLIINCDSYANYDSATHGENADGFAPKLDIGPGNVFRGCRAWDNADDGWDIFEGQNTVVIDSCWAFRNGYNLWGDPSWQGDGNGFKLGGNYIAGAHLVTRSIAFDNRSKGFDQNNNTAGQTIYNCTGFRNLSRNFSLPAAPTTGAHVLKNNISHSGSNSIVAGSVLVANSWQGFTVSDGDFQSLDTLQALAPRNPDGTLPATELFRLATGSDLIDGGVDVGLPFTGPAPDLGAFESGMPLPVQVLLLDPPDGAGFTADSVACRWSASAPSVTAYWFEYSPDSVFTVSIVDSSLIDTAAVARHLPYGTTFWWRVRARNSVGWGPFSPLREFHTVLPVPTAPEVLSPGDGAVDNPLSVGFSWRTVPFAATYRLQIGSDSLFAATVLDDAELVDTTRTVSNFGAGIRYWWRVRAANPSGPGPWSLPRSFTTGTTASGVFSYPEGWTMVALPLGVGDRSVAAVFPAAVGPAYRFLSGAGYVEEDTLEERRGYWVKFPSSQNVPLSGTVTTSDTLELPSGWMMIGPVSVPIPVGEVVENPPGILSSPFYRFSGAYAPVDTLKAGQGYWVKLSTSGTLILQRSLTQSR